MLTSALMARQRMVTIGFLIASLWSVLCSRIVYAQTNHEEHAASKTGQDRSAQLARLEHVLLEGKRQEAEIAISPAAIAYYAELQEENKRLQQDREAALQETAALGQTNTELLQTIERLKQSQEELEVEVTSLTEENARLRATSLSPEALAYYTELQEENKLLHQDRAAAVQETAAFGQANAELVRTFEGLKQSQEELQAQVTSLTEANTRLKATVKDLSWKAQIAEQFKEELESSRKSLDRRQEEHRRALEQLKQEHQTKQQELTKLKEVNVALQADVTKLTEANTRLKTMVQDLTWKAQTAEQSKERLEEERQALTKENLELRERAQQSKASHDENILLREALYTAQKELTKLRKTNVELQAEARKARASEQLLKQQRVVMTQLAPAERVELRESTMALQADLTKLKETNTRLETMVRELRAKVQNAEQLTEQQKTLAEENVQLKQKADALQQTVNRERGGLYRELGAAYTKAQLFDRAIEAYAQSLEQEPDNAQTHYYLGLLYEHARHDDERSITHFEKYLALSPALTVKERREVEYLVQMLKAGKEAKR